MTRNDSRHKVVILVFLFITTVGVWAVDYDPSLDSLNPSEILERSYLTPILPIILIRRLTPRTRLLRS